MNIGKKLKEYRQYKHMTQEQLADMAEVNEKYYGRIERNESCPTITVLEKLCKALNIGMIEFFLLEAEEMKKNFIFNFQISKIITDAMKQDIDIHFNRTAFFRGCEKCIWYNGYIGSMSFDEFELKIYATGNIKARLYWDYEEVLELDSDDISNELMKYVKDDKMLEELVLDMEYDEEVLEEKQGNALFLSDSNWLTAVLVNNSTGQILNQDITLETDNIIESLSNNELFLSCI